MAWNFGKAFAVIPSVRIHVSRTGLSVYIGDAPATINARITNVNKTNLPEGETARESQLHEVEDSQSRHQNPTPRTYTPERGVQEIRSAGWGSLSSSNLESLRTLIREASEQRSTLEADKELAREEAREASQQFYSWDNGSVFKRVFKARFANRLRRHELSIAKLQELNGQLDATKIMAQIDMEQIIAGPYYRMRDAFAAMASCRKVWDKLDFREMNRVIERSAASEAVSRADVYPSLAHCQLMNWRTTVPHLPNRNGGDLYVYPGFILYRASDQAFALLNFREVRLRFVETKFIEDGPVPADSTIVGHAWAKSNKDGSPDRRYRNNYQLPVVVYGLLEFTSKSGLNEAYYVSNPERAKQFAEAWQAVLFSFDACAITHAKGFSFCAPELITALFVSQNGSAKKVNDCVSPTRARTTKRPPFWPYLFTEKLLRENMTRLKSAYRDCAENLIENNSHCSELAYTRWFTQHLNEFTAINNRLASLMAPLSNDAWGENGPLSDEKGIVDFVSAASDLCTHAVLQELDLRSRVAPAHLDSLRHAIKGYAGAYIDEMLGFSSRIRDAVKDAKSGIKVKRSITFTVPSPPASIQGEVDRLQRRRR